MFRRSTTAAEKREKKLRDTIAELQADLQAAHRVISVCECEIETLAAVIARDRARVQAETAAYQRARAESEGQA